MTSTILFAKINGRNLLVALWIVFSITLAIFLLRDVLFVPGLPYTRDLVFPYHLDNTYNHLFFTWNEINSQQNLEVNKIPFFFISSVVSGVIGTEFTVKALFVIVLSSMCYIMFISLYILFHDKVKSTVKLVAICCIPALFYLINPVVVDRISNHLFMVFGMALNPLVVVLFTRILERGAGLSNLSIVAMVITFTSIVSSHNTFYLIPILLFCFSFYIFHPKTSDKKRATKNIGIIFGIYLLLNSYWIFPTLYHELSTGIDPSYSISFASVSKLSNLNSPINVLGLIGGGAWDPVLQYPETIKQISIFLSYVVPLFSLVAILLFPKLRLIALLTTLFVILYFLALGTNSPIPLYQWLLESPIISGILWLFRDPSRSLIYLAFVYSVLLAFVIQRLVGARLDPRIKIGILIIILSGIIISPASFTFINSAGNKLVSSQVPSDFEAIYDFLSSDFGEYNVLWLPFRQYFTYDWNRIDRTVAWNFYHESSPKPSIGVDSESNRNVSKFWQYIYSEILLDYRSNDLGKFLNLYGIKYIIVHDDLSGAQGKEAKRLLQILSFQKDFVLEKHVGPYYLFKNLEYDPKSSMFVTISTDSNNQSSRILSPSPSSKVNNININVSKWNLSDSSALSEIDLNNSDVLFWKSKLNTSEFGSSEITLPIQNMNIRNFEKLEMNIYPFVNNTGRSLSVVLYTNTSDLTFEIKDLSLNKWNRESFDLVNKRLDLSSKSNSPNFLNVTAVGLKIPNEDYEDGVDNFFFVKNIRFIPDAKNDLYNSNIILDNWTQRKLNQNIISNFSKIDPTRYNLEINATEPYVLGFVRSFSPLWVAEVKGAETGNSELNSFPLYLGLNGFWVDRLGQYEIQLKYKSQDWLLIGGYLSIISVIVLTAYIIYGLVKSFYVKGMRKKH